MNADLLERQSDEASQLTNLDRCDMCGAQAYVSAAFKSGTLLFCGHHWKMHKEKAEETAVAIHDETERIG